MDSSIPQRVCKKCSKSLPLTSEFFHKDKKAVHGFCYRCKECAKARSREWHYDNQEYVKERHQEYYLTHIEDWRAYRAKNAEHIAQTKRAWRKNNPDKVAADKKRHYEKHKAKIFTYHRKWSKANPDRALNYLHKRRALKAGNGGDGFTKADKELQLRSQKGRCWWCSKPMGKDVTIDHVIAITKGGKHDPRNIVLAHHSCNSSKGDKLPQDWIGRLF